MAVTKLCNNIHNLVERSGLHFRINQTPFSSYITIRKKLINPESNLASESGVSDDVDAQAALIFGQLKSQRTAFEDTLGGKKHEISALKEKLERSEERFDIFSDKASQFELLIEEKEIKIQNLLKADAKHDSENKSLKQQAGHAKAEHAEHLQALAEFKKAKKVKDKDIHNLNNTVDNLRESNQNLKVHVKEITEERNAANRNTKKAEKNLTREKKNFEKKISELKEKTKKKTEIKPDQPFE